MTGTGVEPQNRPNFDVKEQIREYWSRRSETFDISPGHGIHSTRELEAWKRLVGGKVRDLRQARVLELASGTGEFTRVLLALGYRVEGLDLSEAMIARARAKHGDAVRFYIGDAENTMLQDEVYDAVICRHLVWTLLDPMAAFRDWSRILKPGGRLLVIDGDWSRSSLVGSLAGRISALVERVSPRQPLYDSAAHREIEGQLYFRDGLKATRLAEMLGDAGFEDIHVHPLEGVLIAQMRAASWRDRIQLLQSSGRHFVVSARRGDSHWHEGTS